MEKAWKLIEILVVLGAVYFGFALSSCSEQSRIEGEYKKVRAALKIEIEINDGKVRDIWEKANNYEPNPMELKGNLSEDEKVELLKKVIRALSSGATQETPKPGKKEHKKDQMQKIQYL